MGNPNLDEELTDLDNLTTALEMRRVGRSSYTAIGKALGISKQAAYQKVKRALRLFQRQATEEYRQSELERMDILIGILWPSVAAGKLGAVDRYITASKHRAELAGAYAPKQVQALNINLDFSKLSTSQLERLARGEDLYTILADISHGDIVEGEVITPKLPAEVPFEKIKLEGTTDATTSTDGHPGQSGAGAETEAGERPDSFVPGVSDSLPERPG